LNVEKEKDTRNEIKKVGEGRKGDANEGGINSNSLKKKE